ncbi:MAG: alpha/beta hydrolase [Agarilytica sp.]
MSDAYKDMYYQSSDGLTLYARDYENPSATQVVMLLHGFTRNSADFAELSEQLRADYRLIVPDQRGRGLSAYDSNTDNYNPAVYVNDMFTLLDTLKIESVMLIGTSMGGVISMTMASMKPALVKAIVLNDVGPEVEPEGLQRVVDSMGNNPTINNWDDAVAYAKEVNGVAYPDYTDEDWEVFSKNIYKFDDDGKPVAAFDSGTYTPIKDFNAYETPLTIWPVFDAAKSTDFMVIRGELSDILSRECVDKLKAYDNVLTTIEVPNVGHAPTLNEAVAVNGIRDFLANIK